MYHKCFEKLILCIKIYKKILYFFEKNTDAIPCVEEVKNMRKIPKKEFRESDDPFYNLEKAASANDCTGLMPSAPLNSEDAKNYSELYAIHLSERNGIRE